MVLQFSENFKGNFKANGEIKLTDEVAGSAESVIGIIDSIYDARAMQPENAHSNNVELSVDEDKLAISGKSKTSSDGISYKNQRN